jgi:hypothetical protein
MNKLKTKILGIFFLTSVFLPEIARGEDCGILAFGNFLKVNRHKVCVTNDAGRECAVIIDPCPIQ